MRTTIRFGKKMKQQKPRIKKARKESTHERKLRNPPQITGLWGRAASEHRPGLLTKQYLMEHGEACAADIYYTMSRELERINEERIATGEIRIRRPNYSSFARYFHWFKKLGLVEPAGKIEPSIYDLLKEKTFFKLTDRGRAERRAWEDPIAVAHPELR